jgi:hypothetical protein
LYVASVVSRCFKSRFGVALVIHVGSGSWRRWATRARSCGTRSQVRRCWGIRLLAARAPSLVDAGSFPCAPWSDVRAKLHEWHLHMNRYHHPHLTNVLLWSPIVSLVFF